ncbi:MAG: cytochrome c oxidase subunit II [Nocardioidaceae bacterium]|nr:cytochrome c oxidase subunit II [Nocardioidaceae bacterium]
MSRILTERTARGSQQARRAAASAVGSLSLLALTGCSEETTGQWKRLGLPEPASDRAPYMGDLWIGSWVAAGLIGVFVWGLIIWAAVRYRRRGDDDLPVQVRYNLPIEVLYTVAPFIVVAVLFFFTVETQNKVLEEVPNPDHEVHVTAQQWSWTFSYLGEPAVEEQDVYEVGTAAELPELWLVEDESVTFTLHSPDVIHSFWVPSFYFKRDVIPGRDQQISLTPTKVGEFDGYCAELCGFQHSRMLFTVKVVDQAAYDQHLRDLLAAGQIGVPKGSGNSENIVGLETGEEGGE